MTNDKQQHLQWSWNCTRLGVLILPLIPSLGEAGLILALISLWRQNFAEIRRYRLNWGLGVFSLWLVVNCCLAFKPREAWEGLANFLPFLALLPALTILIRTPAQLRQLAWSIAIPSLPIVLLGFGQIWGNWGLDQPVLQALGWQLKAGGEPPGRMSSVFTYANVLAAYLLIALIFTLGLWLITYQTWRTSKSKDEGWMVLFLTFTAIADGLGLVLTNSRNAWGIALISCLAFALYLGWRWLVLALTTTAGSVLWASFGPSPGRQWLRRIVPAYFWARFSDELYTDRHIVTLRTTQWKFSWNLTLQRPLTGWGLRNFTPLYQAKMDVWLGHPHNLFVMLMAETGIPSTLLFSGLIGWIFLKAVQLLNFWLKSPSQQNYAWRYGDPLILFTYLVAFSACTLFNCSDVTLFDLRVNTLGWILLSAISGVVYAWRGNGEQAIGNRQ